jgi:hypothetical protein
MLNIIKTSYFQKKKQAKEKITRLAGRNTLGRQRKENLWQAKKKPFGRQEKHLVVAS